MALAVVRSGRVDTVPVDTGVTHTLIHIWKGERRDKDATASGPQSALGRFLNSAAGGSVVQSTLI